MSAPHVPRVSGWDRVAIVALGGAGCALSYDALQQMAAAIHVRGLLTYLFPLVIDGFIAYGVRALLVLRTAPLASRCYVWALFGTATAASIWANALHAVRLNQDRPGDGGLRLGDLTVGVLSTLAPLALAGAVHLYILIARRTAEPVTPGQQAVPADGSVRRAGRDGTERPGTPGHRLPAGEPSARGTAGRAADSGGGKRTPSTKPSTEIAVRDADQGGQPEDRPAAVTLRRPDRPTAPGRRQAPDTVPPDEEQLLDIGREAVAASGKVTRRVVADAVRGQHLPLSNDRLTVIVTRLRAETDPDTDTA